MNMFDEIDESYSKKPKSEYYKFLKRSDVYKFKKNYSKQNN